MSKTVQQDARQRTEITWDIWPVPRTDNLRLTRKVTTYPITKAGSVQWRRGEVHENEPVVIAADEVTALIAELLLWLRPYTQEEDTNV